MMSVGSSVKIKEPFNQSFSGVYIIADLGQSDDGQDVVYLDGLESAFDPKFIEVIES